MKIKKSELINLVKEEAVKLYKKRLVENDVINSDSTEVDPNSGEQREKHVHEMNVYEDYGKNLTEVVGNMREVVTMLQDMKLKQEAHESFIPEGSERANHYQKAKNVIEKAAGAADGFAQKLNKLAIVMLKDLE